MFARIIVFFYRNYIHIPNSDDEVSELNVSFKLCANELVVLEEILQSDSSIVREAFICTVQSSKEIEKLEPRFFYSFDIWPHIGVSRRIKFTLYFVKFQKSIMIVIKALESFSHQAGSRTGQLSN